MNLPNGFYVLRVMWMLLEFNTVTFKRILLRRLKVLHFSKMKGLKIFILYIFEDQNEPIPIDMV